MTIQLTARDFAALTRGEVIEVEGRGIALVDMGFAQMRRAVNDAEAQHEASEGRLHVRVVYQGEQRTACGVSLDDPEVYSVGGLARSTCGACRVALGAAA